MFFKRKKEPVRPTAETLTVEKCSDMLSDTVSGYLAQAKHIADAIMGGTDEEKKSLTGECYMAFQAGFYIEAAGRVASAGAETALTGEQAEFGVRVAKELFKREYKSENGDRLLKIAFHFSVKGHEAAYQIGRREGQRFVRKEKSSLPEPDKNSISNLLACIQDGTYEQIVLT